VMSQEPSLILQGGGSMASGDMNGDGWVDLAIEKWFHDTVFVYFGGMEPDSIGGFILTEGSELFGYGALAAADIDGDGYDDVIVGTQDQNSSDTTINHRGRIFIYPGAPVPHTSPVEVLMGDTIRAGLGVRIQTGDVNADGWQDLIALEIRSKSGYLHKNNLVTGHECTILVYWFLLTRSQWSYDIDARQTHTTR